MRLVWSENAIADLLSIHRYIAGRNPAAAQKAMRVISAAALQLEQFPELGRPASESGSRLLQVPRLPYLLPYRIMNDGVIEILAVFDERMERPKAWL